VLIIVAVEIPRLVAFLADGRDWTFACYAIRCGLMAGLPFLLGRIAPEAAGFDRQWLPSAWSHWGWFLGMLVLLLVGGGMIAWLAGFGEGGYGPYGEIAWRDSFLERRPTSIVLSGFLLVLVVPIAEELFWRAYMLEQLRKLMHSGLALLIHSLLFALSHFWLFHYGMLLLVAPFWYGTILGMWRIRFRSVLPLMLAHVIINAVALVPSLKIEYDYASQLWAKPPLAQIDLLTEEPIPRAVPAIIAFLADPDEDVRNYATLVLITRYRGDIEPYAKEALASSDPEIVKGVLFVIDMTRLSALGQEVRRVAWSSNDPTCQLAATTTLGVLEDAEGLRKISKEHPDETVRKTAKWTLHSGEERGD